MKTKILSLVSAVGLLLGLSACQDPHEFSPTTYDEHFDSMTASFFDDDRDENKFPAEFDYQNHIITIVVPYTYPNNTDSYLEMSDLTRMKVQCNLKKGLVLNPALTVIDLTKDTPVTITDGYGVKTNYTIRGEIRKSTACEILDFTIPSIGISGVINPETHVITLVTADEIGEQVAAVDLSHGATLSPDPRVEPVNWDNEPVITCIAQNGTTKQEYTFIKANPDKLPFGIRPGSAKIAWAKKQKDLGLREFTTDQINTDGGSLRFDGSAGLGVVGENLVLNEAGTNKAYVLNMKNGNLISTIDLSVLGTNSAAGCSEGNNHRMAGDKHGNLLFAVSRLNNNGVMQLWRMKGIDGQLEKIADYSDAAAMCNTLSVTGDLYGDAVITSNANGGLIAYQWVIKGGHIVSSTPTKFTPGGYSPTANCWATMDIVRTSNDPESDYFTIGYMPFDPLPPTASGTDNRTCALHDGKTNAIKAYGNVCITSNSVENAGDYIEFNNSKYFIHNVCNTLGYGYGASLLMYDVTPGNLQNIAIDFNGGDIAFTGNYGSMAACSTGRDAGANSNDVVFHISEDGFYLYIFFEYGNGYVGAVRCDCIDM